MSGDLLRPTFELMSDIDDAGVAAQLKSGFARLGDGVESRWARGDRHALLAVARAERRWWSPWLHVDVRRAEAGGTLVFGRFTPNPALWTGYMLCLIALLAIALFALALALAQMTLEWPAWGWWLFAGSLVAAGGLVGGARVAQRLAAAQMRELHRLVEDALGGSEHPRESPGRFERARHRC